MKFKEIEVKYYANHIPIIDFCNVLENLDPSKSLMASSYDDFFINNSCDFIRYRHNDTFQELTIKHKTSRYNNFERIEVNLSIAPQDLSVVTAFVELLGYSHNFRIFKTAKIYWINNVVICYYIVYDENMNELNRFIEIEANEEIDFINESQAWESIKYYEEKLKILGVSPKKRLKLSLFEMYKK